MKLVHSITFSDQYNINPQKYTNVHITLLPVSARIINRFQDNHIHTLAELLGKTPDDLKRIKGFGKGCFVEIDDFFSSLQDDLPSQVTKEICLPRNLAHRYRHSILHGNFSFINDKLTDEELEAFGEIREAYETLGADLVNECVVNPVGVQNIVLMLQTFCLNTERLSEIDFLMKAIPTYRRQNLALGYINAYTQDESKRKLLASQYASNNATLEQLIGNKLEDKLTFIHVKNFLKWCTFDLSEDISTLINAVTEQTKLKAIVEMRARKFTLAQCGDKLGLTRERIRQLEAKALRIFASHQKSIRLIPKISAEKNGNLIITAADIERYCGECSTELIFLLRNYKNSTYIYDGLLDIFIIGDNVLHDQVSSFVETLPEVFSIKKIPKYLEIAKTKNYLPIEMVEIAISESYKLTGEVYHRSRLSLATIYTAILQEYYPNGIKVYDPIEISRFRSLVIDNYGDVKMPENDRALAARITGICILCGKGTYKLKQKQYIPKSLAKKIYDYITNSDEDIFLMSTLFHIFEVDLCEAGIDNKYYLQGILHELYGDKLIFTRDYVSKDGRETSIYSSVVDYIQQSCYPVSKKQIQEKFPGISDIVISFSISNPNVLNYFGEYLHASKLSITPEEEHYLDKVIQRVCGDGSAHHVKDFYEIIDAEKPEILRRNAAMYPFSAFSILEYLFRNNYQFSRPYIALQGVEIGRPAERLHDLLYDMDEFTFDDISDFTKENHFVIQSQLDYVNSCNDKYLIVNETTVKSIDKIGVTEAIAYEVEKAVLCEVSDTIPISQLTCWKAFPPINTPWTEWLVYSVLNKWSTRLTVAPSFNQFRLSIPLVAPIGKLDVTPFADAYKEAEQTKTAHYTVADNLDNIDDILVDMIGKNILEDDIWD